jgi:serine phosphatase RsbU (regulator of sigma subunit)
LPVWSQDTVVVNKQNTNLNKSIASQFSIYDAGPDELLIEDVLSLNDLEFFPIETNLANLDFTTSNYWIHFVILNEDTQSRELIFETARPITNTVNLYEISDKGSVIIINKSGDGIDFNAKQIKKNKSLFRIYIGAKQKKEFWLHLSSDGEVITLPMVFWDADEFEIVSQRNQFFSGIFYGIFIFVIAIYVTFFILLKEGSFLLYVFYVFFSGFMNFCLDGYAHQYIFTSGGYWTQHSVLIMAGLTVVFVVQYAASYLKLKSFSKKLNTISQVFSGIVFLAIILSLFPGKTYEIAYPLINGFSLIATVFALYIAIYAKYKKQEVNILFLIGMIVLISGAVIFILGNFGVIDSPKITQVALKVATLIEIICLSIVMAGKYKILQQEKEDAQAELLARLEGVNEKLEFQVHERTKEIEAKNVELEHKNNDILSSIKYAERIQRALLPSTEKFSKLLPESFVLFKPRDIVSGDFYWIESVMTEDGDQMIVYVTADCTGHGVPGAFVSIVSSSLLDISRSNRDVNTPAEALDFLNKEINKTFNSQYSEEKIRDGMDVVICALKIGTRELSFAGAKNPLFIIRNQELIEIKGDKQPVGLMDEGATKPFSNHELTLQENDVIYTFSDGYADQFGGERGKKFMYRKFKELLVSIAMLPMNEQKKILDTEFESWKGDLDQLDDVLVIGVRVI